MEEEITALLAGVAGGRRHWFQAPQDAPRPYVVMQRITGRANYHMKGPSGYVLSRVQIDCYADTRTEAKVTARAVTAALSGYRGGTIQGMFLDGQRDLPAADAGDVSSLFRTSIDFTIHHGD
ncbi:DUF3168 domain-containing protein [Mycoplana rhizolycopersici]|uniref:DUF3168 domain-containing protein n=1 Tax=Mycoplana rhizolycopersici TaxID=2746702 RepID=A0ABX2QE52_9HYPH|nr:DUF3168 domain-containing protein [Rhizobium rhizolycopersici]NVP55965.1 DUF3168 domain-containing protein [Rhizobium rhizolycopersici]